MPREEFYEGLTLSEQLQKFLDFHYAPKQRHISAFEAALMSRAKARIDQTIAVATDEAREEVQAVYQALLQLYETLVLGAERVVSAQSLPIWHLEDPVGVLQGAGLQVLTSDPTPSDVQAAVAALLASDPEDLQSRYEALRSNTRTLEQSLGPDELALVNRLLYLPTIAAENSWADIAPLLEHLNRAKSKGASTAIFGGTLLGTHDVVIAILAGGSVIVLQLLQEVAAGMAPGLRGLGELLTRSWRASDATEE